MQMHTLKKQQKNTKRRWKNEDMKAPSIHHPDDARNCTSTAMTVLLLQPSTFDSCLLALVCG